MKAVVQVSGGLDSTIAYAEAVSRYGEENVFPITFDDGSMIWKQKDSVAVKLIMVYYRAYGKLFVCRIPQSDLLEFPLDKDFPDVGFIPGLKMHMNSSSMAYAQKVGADEVWVGNMADNVYKDESEQFLGDLERLYNTTYETDIRIIRPFKDLSRSDVLVLGRSLKVPLSTTVSCGNGSRPGSLNCGTCDWCQKRKTRFIEAKIPDETIYHG